jgi:hypothetical protein
MTLANIVKKNQISEKEYRSLKDRLSYSALKTFDADRKRFYNEFILGNPKEDKESSATVLGSLVHSLLSGEEFEEKFYLFQAIEPKGQMKELADALFSRSLKGIVDGVQTEKFTTLFADAVQSVKYDKDNKEIAFKGKDMEKILEMFKDSDAEMYYNERLNTIGKTIVTVGLVTQAETLVEKLRGHSYTYSIVNARGENIDVFNEVSILFEVNGVPYKSLVDRLIVDHTQKTIQPIDWKTSWDNEDPTRAYLKFGYYLQAGLYDFAIKKWKQEHQLTDYAVLPMKFVFCDTSGFADPVILEIQPKDLSAAWAGFYIRGYYYRGLTELMKDIAWHVETGNWATAKEIFDGKGCVKVDVQYETSR